MRTVQAKWKTDKRQGGTPAFPRSKMPLDVARASIMTLLALVVGRAGRVHPGTLEGLGALAALGRMAPAALARRVQLRKDEATRLAAAFELGRRVMRDAGAERYVVHTSRSVARWFRMTLGPLVHEELWLLALDVRGGVRGARCIARGGISGASFGPVDIMRNALELGASSFVLVHNHPSGQTEPSFDDVILTVLAYNAGEVLRVPLSDHVIVAGGRSYFSFRDSGLLPVEPVDPKLWIPYLRRAA